MKEKQEMCGRCESPLERKFHKAWLGYKPANGITLETQITVPVQSFKVRSRRIDFGFSAIKLGIEIDSMQFHSKKDEKKRDKERERELKQQGWKLIHLDGKSVYHWPVPMANRVLLEYYKRVHSQRSIFHRVWEIFR